MMDVAYRLQRNSGMRNHVIPAGRIMFIVTRKFRPVKMELKPRMKTPRLAVMTLVFVVVLYGV